MGITVCEAEIPLSEVSWGKGSDRCVVLYGARLSPKTTRCPSIMRKDTSFVFIPGISNTAVRMDSAGSSIRSILEKKNQERSEVQVFSDLPWSVFRHIRWRRPRCNDSELPRFYCFYAFDIGSSIDGLDKGRMARGLEALTVCSR